MALHDTEFLQLIHELESIDPDVKRLATQRMYVLMTGGAAADESTAASEVKAMAQAIDAAL